MSRFNGNNLRFEIYGASHAEKIGIRASGLPAGEAVDMAALRAFLLRRAPGNSPISTSRREADEPVFLSGICESKTDGTELCAEIINNDVRKSDYVNLNHIPRPGHADFAAWQKLGLEHDMSGGGEFSGRMTAPLCILGGIAKQILARRGIEISADAIVNEADIVSAKESGDSVGGEIKCRVSGVPSGLGSAGTEGLESLISSLVFGIPAVKEIRFGDTKMRGSENNDAFVVKDGKVVTETNHHGGILGGISTGMPIEFSILIKPTPSIALEQNSVSLDTMESVKISVGGRHDPCIVPRAVPVAEACAAIAILDVMLTCWDIISLGNYRSRIDSIDAEIQRLLDKRTEICCDIADYKAANGLPTLDASREEQKLAKISPEYKEIFREIMRASREKQEERRNG